MKNQKFVAFYHTTSSKKTKKTVRTFTASLAKNEVGYNLFLKLDNKYAQY